MGYIFESEIEAIIHAVRIKTIGEDEDITLEKIISANIHPAVKAYFAAEVEKMLLEERVSEQRSKKFPYSLPEIRSLEEQIDLLLVHHYQFNQHEFESLLDESVHFQFNYLCRPQWTLLNFVIGEQRRVPAALIEKRLNYCVDYSYFPELIKRYLVDHGLAEVTYEEFKTLIERIDTAVVDQHSSLELAHMTRALFDFVESGKMIPQTEFEQQSLPINAAIVFFEDKHLNDIRVRLEFERDRNRVLQLTADRLAEIIEIVRVGDENAILPQTLSHTVKDVHIPDVIEVKDPLDKTAESALGALPSEEPIVATAKPHVLVFGENDEQYLSSTPSARQMEIQNLFTQEEKSVLLKKIFDDDEPAFRAAVIALSLLHAWEQVALALDTLYLIHGVNPFSEEAVLFTDKLSAHFHSSADNK